MATSKITQQQLTEDYSCGYCLQRLSYMTDPRELPCSHVFCLPCLQADSEKDKGIECTVCGRSHVIRDCDGLPRIRVAHLGQPFEQLEEKLFIQCDLCKDSKSGSTVYCTDCGKKLCAHHLKVHEESLQLFLQKTHSIIRIEEYIKNVSRHQLDVCKQHEGEMHIHACQKCHKTFCIRCQTGEICENGEGGTEQPHTIVMLEEFASQLRKQLKTSMKSLSDKISYICMLEKNAWGNLSELEVRVKDIMEEVDEIVEEQFAQIRNESSDLKGKIEDYLTKATEQVERYAVETMATKEQMEDLWRNENNLLIRNKDGEVVQQQKENIEQLEQAISSHVEPFRVLKGALVSTGQFQGLWIRFVEEYAPPAAIEFSKQYTVRQISAVCWTRDGSLIVGGDMHLELLNGNMESIKSSKPSLNISSIDETDTNFVALSYASIIANPPNSRVVTPQAYEHSLVLYSPELQQIRSVSKLPGANSKLKNLVAVVPFTHQIIAITHSLKKLEVYTKQGDLLYAEKLKGIETPQALHALEDGCVLLADNSSKGSLSKYRIGEQETLHIWTCIGLTNPTAICSDAAGFIYCVGATMDSTTGSSKPAISIISEKGKLLRHVTHQMLESGSSCDIAVSRDDKLALARDGSGVLVFDIVRGEL